VTLHDDGSDPILEGISTAIRAYMHGEHGREVEPVVVEFVLIAGWLDEDGVWNLFHDAAEGQRSTQSLGLLRAAVLHEERALAEMFDDGDE
jgi:hypothetical protein